MATAWTQLSERVWLVPGGVNAAVLHGPDGAVLVDSGATKDAGARILRELRARGWPLRAIVTSHAHADHFGGHAAILRQERVPVFAPEIEAEVMRAPVLEPIALFHGAVPPVELTGPWLQAEASPVDHVVAAGRLDVAGLRLELLDVAGHAPRQLAVAVDDVLLAADGVFGAEITRRYPLLFAHDPLRQRRAAESVVVAAARLGARLTVPGHGAPAEAGALAETTVAAIDRARDAVLSAADGVPATTVLARVAVALDLQMPDLPRYHLNSTTVLGYLSGLRAAGAVRAVLEGGELLWAAA